MQREMQLYLETMPTGYRSETQEVMFGLTDNGEIFIHVGHNPLKFSVEDLQKVVNASNAIRSSEDD